MKLKDQTKVYKMLDDSKTFTESYTSSFDENERLKEGLPRTSIPSNYPRVTDKSLSKKINDTPKRVFQKVPDFTVDTGADPFTDVCAEYVLVGECIGGDDDGYSFYQKLINAGRDAAGFGLCAVYLPFEFSGDSYKVGFVPIYWGDLLLEKYCTNINSSHYTIIRQWKNEWDLQEIFDNTDEDVDDGWKRDKIKELIDNKATKTRDPSTPGSRKAGITEDMFEIFTYVSKDEFITFTRNPDYILRQKDNKSKARRVVGLYYDFDGVNPLGRSMVDIGGDLQNLIDSDMQAYQFNRAISLQPPVFVSGDVDSGDGIYMPNNVITVDDPQTAAKPLEISTTAIEQYPNLYALQMSQMNKLIPDADDTTIPSEATGGLASSKTSTGINQNKMTQGVYDNFFFKNAEAFLGAWATNALNIYFREFDGVIELQLNNEYADKARAINSQAITPDGKVQLDCSQVTKIKVKVEPGSTRDLAREEDMQRLSGIINMEGQSEIVASTIGQAGTQEIVKSMVKSSGVTNAGDIMAAIDEGAAMNQMAPQGEQPQPEPGAEESAQLDLLAKGQKIEQDAEMHQAKLQNMRSNK